MPGGGFEVISASSLRNLLGSSIVMLDLGAVLTFVILFCAMLGSGCKVCGKEGFLSRGSWFVAAWIVAEVEERKIGCGE